MVHYKFTNGGRIKTAQNWTFTTNPYITSRPLVHCVGDECKMTELDVYYQYGDMESNPPVLIHYVPVIVIIILIIIIVSLFLYKRAKANERYEESMLSRMDEVRIREYVYNL